MCDEKNPPEDTLLKFYGMLVDQLHKTSTLLWQLPTALFAANAFALDKFLMQPWIVLGLSLFDFAMVYACCRVRVTQSALIPAIKEIEKELLNSSLKNFVPDFKQRKGELSAPDTIVALLALMSAALFVYSLCQLLC
jgi:hypothetical protein